MPSPFPGMDPFIESQGFWPDFHATFINYVRERLADQLLDSYDARLDERVNFVRVRDDSVQRIRPDVSISQSDARDTGAATSGGLATLEPVTLQETIEEGGARGVHRNHQPRRSLAGDDSGSVVACE